MNKKIKKLIKNVFYLIKWFLSSRQGPPPYVYKRHIIKKYAKKYSLSVLVETGTFFGDTVNELLYNFKKIYSVEVDDKLYNKAKNRFLAYNWVDILKGDSTVVLPNILKKETDPIIFWLDGHYSGGETGKAELNTPILAELETILNNYNEKSVILIDDARCYNGLDDYPSVNGLIEFIKQRKSDLDVLIKDDIIRVFKNSQKK